jgi:N-acyl-D-amino-acid deacylase
MALDLIIRDAVVIDGSGATRFGADVAISGGKIAAVGKVDEAAKEVIQANIRDTSRICSSQSSTLST